MDGTRMERDEGWKGVKQWQVQTGNQTQKTGSNCVFKKVMLSVGVWSIKSPQEPHYPKLYFCSYTSIYKRRMKGHLPIFSLHIIQHP